MNRVVVITGGSRGLGRYTAEAFCEYEECALVFSHNTNVAAAQEVAGQLESKAVQVNTFRLSQGDPKSVFVFFDHVRRLHGTIDVLVNNAGMNLTNDFDQQSLAEWNEVVAVNLTGVFLCCQAALPLMSSSGRIINIGSVSGQLGGPRSPAYAAAKAGVIGLTHCLARFVADRGITANCVSPGVIASELTTATMPPDLQATRQKNILLRRFGAYQEVASAVVYLASQEASFITAQTINVNGGEWW